MGISAPWDTPKKDHMSAEEQDPEERGAEGKAEEPATESRNTRGKMGDGIKQGIGVLSAFKDAL